MKSNHSAAGLTYIQAGQTPEAQAVNNNRLSLFAILLLFMLTPFTHGSSEFRAHQSRYDDPLLNMVAEDRETLEKFNAQSKATIGSVERKTKQIDSMSQAIKTNTKTGIPLASEHKKASATLGGEAAATSIAKRNKPTASTQGFMLSVKEQRLSRAAGETAIYHFSTLVDRTLEDKAPEDRALEQRALIDTSLTGTSLVSEKLGGQICLSLASSLPGARLSKERVHPGDTFSLLVPSNSDARWGDYMFTVTASADGGNWVKQQSVNLSLLPGDIREIQQANFTWHPITDNAPEGIVSRIAVEDELAAFGVRVLVNVSHTWHRDLSMTLTSPTGTSYQLVSESHAGGDNQHREYRTQAFNHEAIKGD